MIIMIIIIIIIIIIPIAENIENIAQPSVLTNCMVELWICNEKSLMTLETFKWKWMELLGQPSFLVLYFLGKKGTWMYNI